MIKMLSPIFAFTVGIVIFLVFLLPGWDEIKGLKALKENKIQTLKDLGNWSVYFDDLSVKYQLAENDLQKLSLTVPPEPQIPELLVQLEDIARRNGLAVDDVQFNLPASDRLASLAKPTDKNLGVVNVKIKMEGDYNNFKNFTADIEKNIRLMDISLASLGGGSEGFMKFEAEISTYYQNSL